MWGEAEATWLAWRRLKGDLITTYSFLTRGRGRIDTDLFPVVTVTGSKVGH